MEKPQDPALRLALAKALDIMPDAVIMLDADQRILFFNQGAERIFGYHAEEMQGQSLDLLLPPRFVAAHHDHVRAFAATPDIAKRMGDPLQVRGRRKDGSEFPAEVSLSKLVQHGQLTFTVILRDTTDRQQIEAERKRAEEALRESEERYRSIVTAMQEGIVFQDADGHIIACNASAERILGLSLDQMMGRTSLDPRWRAIHEDGSPFPGDAHPAMVTLRTGQPQSNVIMGVHKPDGTLTWISINSQPLCRSSETLPYAVVTSFTDITARRQAEQSLHESEELYRLLYDNSSDGILLTAPDGSILAANPAACHMFGRTEEEICRVGRNGVVDLSDPRLAAALEERARAGRFRSELFLVRQDGTRFSGEVTSNVFKDKEGQIRTSMIVRDITRRKQAEEALRESEARLRVLVEQTPAILWTADTQLRFTSAQGASLASLGLQSDQVLGRLVSGFGPSDDPNVGTIVDAHRRALRGESLTYETNRRGRAFQSHVEPLHDAEGRIVGCIGVALDITDRVQAYQLLEQRVQERTRELSTLLEISRNVASTLELRPLMRLIIDQLGSVVNYTSAAIFTLEDEELVILEYQVPNLDRPALPLRLPLEEAGLGQQVIRNREPIIVGDVQGDIPLARAVQRSGRTDVKVIFSYARSWMAIPLIAKDKVVGMLGLAYERPGYYTAQHAELVLAIANQAAIAMENARLYEQARQLSALEERQRLARELHDSVSQALYGIALGARTARTLLDRAPSKAAEPLDYVRSLAEAGLAEMRALIFELRPESLEAEGLAAALTKQAEALRARHGLDVQLDLCEEPSVSLEVRAALYRIAQEALHNIVKHARASHADLQLSCSEASTVLAVKDNGLGFDTSELFPGHLGLSSMRERAERMGGSFEIESAPGRGTRIRVEIPTTTGSNQQTA